MRWAMGVSLSILAVGTMMVIQGHIIKGVNDTAKAFTGDNKLNLESTMKGVYNPSTVASKGSLEFNLKSSLMMYDKQKNQLIISNQVGDLTNKNVELLTPVIVSDTNVSIFNKAVNSINVNVVPREKDFRYYEKDGFFSETVSQALQKKLDDLNANPSIPKKFKQRYISR